MTECCYHYIASNCERSTSCLFYVAQLRMGVRDPYCKRRGDLCRPQLPVLLRCKAGRQPHAQLHGAHSPARTIVLLPYKSIGQNSQQVQQGTYNYDLCQADKVLATACKSLELCVRIWRHASPLALQESHLSHFSYVLIQRPCVSTRSMSWVYVADFNVGCCQDQGIVDEFLPQVLFDALQSTFSVFGTPLDSCIVHVVAVGATSLQLLVQRVLRSR